VDLLTIASGVAHGTVALSAESEPLFQINLFQVIIAAANFLVFLAIIWTFAFKPISKMLADRKVRIEEGLKDAEQARRDRESAESERVATLQDARRESQEILARAQKVAQDARDSDIAATKAELERMRERAAAANGPGVRDRGIDLESADIRTNAALQCVISLTDVAWRSISDQAWRSIESSERQKDVLWIGESGSLDTCLRSAASSLRAKRSTGRSSDVSRVANGRDISGPGPPDWDRCRQRTRGLHRSNRWYRTAFA
jgi:F-type H+-transporting ATPase subunit b